MTGNTGRVDPDSPSVVVEELFSQVERLLEANAAGENDADFIDDFVAYWSRSVGDDKRLHTLFELRPPSRLVVTAYGHALTVVAENEQVARQFFRNYQGRAQGVSTQAACALWLNSLPAPAEYPSDVVGLRDLVEKCSDAGLAILDELLEEGHDKLHAVLMGPTKNGIGAAGGVVIDAVSDNRARRAIQDNLNRGFRRGHTPAQVMAQRYRLSRLSVNRIEQAKSRRPAYLSNELLTKTVCVIGCGSLGSGVAKLLLQSGVGSLKLIDPEVMTWANTERHELGAASVGKNKAQELANHFSRNYPLCGGVIAYKNQWQEVLRAEPEMFGKADLVLSTCANWNAECALNDAHRAGQFSGPVLYGWLEDYAIAGHALAIGGGGTCLRCGFSKTGEVLVPVSRSAPPHVPGCGGGASPYGAIDMAPTQAMIASLALDLLLGRASAPVYRVSISPKATFASADADYSFEWLSQYGEPPCGGTITAGFWRQNENCVCHS